MISEPEMTEGFGSPESGDVVGDLATQRSGRREPSSWPCALGGAVAASALWAVGVFALGPGDQGADLRGYRLDQGVCRRAELASLQGAIAPKDTADITDDEILRHPAVDQVHCSVALRKDEEEKPGGGWAVTDTVGISVALHRTSDPRGEFEAGKRVTDFGVVDAIDVKAVPDLGDEAFLIVKDAEHTELRVLDGAAVLGLSLSTTSYYQGEVSGDDIGDPPELPDVSTYWPDMIDDMRGLMADSKHS
ncbi:hypothetical protein [Streptomyces sp. NPDC003247]|uniref:hypothetical protein n=1 Tax=Streptomyces sp. NPDC003247 TaxID=3364677 RepID=UPI00367AE5CF